MRFRVACVGRPHGAALAALIEDYEGRAARYWPLEVVEVREARGRDPAQVRRTEAERLHAAGGSSLIVACDERGRALDSVAFAERLQGWREAARDVTFVIGGAHGLDREVLAPGLTLQLAQWTLPHELARLILAEQLYRAGTIVRREPYHK
jgi:23S rRNA (pseudouridine1915-N3)-methyltransferase